MIRLARAAILAAALVSCGGDAADTTTTSPPTTAPPSTATTTDVATTAAQTTTTAAATTTSTTITPTTTTTTAPPPPAAASLAMTRVVFEPSSYVVITNVGGEPAELGEHWLCMFPGYQQLPAQTLEPGDSVAIGLDTAAPPDLVDFVAVFELGPVIGIPRSDGGELGLYDAADFGSPAAIVDYVEWGFSGHQRSPVAVEAGIWSDGAFIAVPEEALAISSSGVIGGNEADWFVDIGG